MNVSETRRFVVVVAILLVTFIAAVPIGTSAASQSSRDAVDAGHLSPSGSVFVLFAAVFNNSDATAAAELISDDALLHTRYGDYVGPEGVLDYVAFVKRAFPDAEFHISAIESHGDTVDVEWTMTASRVQMDPVELPYDADVTITGTLSFLVTDTQIVGMTDSRESMAIVVPGELIASPGSIGWA